MTTEDSGISTIDLGLLFTVGTSGLAGMMFLWRYTVRGEGLEWFVGAVVVMALAFGASLYRNSEVTG